MARILPDMPLGAISPEATKLYRLFKQLPGDYFTIWHRLSIYTTPGPDFWVLHQDNRALLLKVSTATSADARTSNQANLFQSNTIPFGKTEQAALDGFRSRLNIAIAQHIKSAIAFPNITSADLKRALPDDATWIGKDELSPDDFVRWLTRHLGLPLSLNDIEQLRQAFTPEVVIPEQFTVRQPIDRKTAASLTHYLLDYNQEWALKSDLDLPQEGRSTASDFGLRLVNGVAGSGKSLIIVYRAHLLKKLYPHKRILVLTHNRPLIHDLESRYQHLNKGDKSIEWRTFLAWCRRYWPSTEEWSDPVGQRRRKELITQAWHAHLTGTSISERVLLDEIDWYKDRLLFSRDDYLAADRTGRGFALNEALRQKMYDAMGTYQRELAKQKLLDWGDVPRTVWQHAKPGKIKLPLYDVVMIDEAQFFAPIWFEIVKQIVRPTSGHLFLVADPTQGFLKRRQSWLAVGLEVRGRTHRLAKCYRTTREILNFATLLYRTRLPQDDDDIVVAGEPDLLNMPSGALPVIVPLTSEQDEITRVVNEVKSLVASGVPMRHILAIHADWQGVDRLLDRIRRELGPTAAVDPKGAPRGDCIRVCTLNAATGLESPIVFISGVHALYEEEQSLRLSEEERLELIRDNTRRLYMAITRAGQRLVLTYAGTLPDHLKHAGVVA